MVLHKKIHLCQDPNNFFQNPDSSKNSQWIRIRNLHFATCWDRYGTYKIYQNPDPDPDPDPKNKKKKKVKIKIL